MDRFLLLLATGFGTGYARKAPGTVGSLLGPVLAWLACFDKDHQLSTIIIGVVLFVIGIPICQAGIRLLHAKDPSQVVFDEIAAFAWVYLFVPFTPTTVIIGFILFRVFDIAKPWPISYVERWPGAWGVMADDALAGIFAGLIIGLAWQFLQG